MAKFFQAFSKFQMHKTNKKKDSMKHNNTHKKSTLKYIIFSLKTNKRKSQMQRKTHYIKKKK